MHNEAKTVGTADLPNLLQFTNGEPVRTAAEWGRRRVELLDQLLEIEYGRMPPPAMTIGEELSRQPAQRSADALHRQYRLTIGGGSGVHFVLDLLIPQGGKTFPVVLNGDGCWRYITDEIIANVLGRGMILARFNRVEIVPDNLESGRTGAIHRLYPDGDFGAIAAWAWGYHRCVDFLSSLDCVDLSRIVIFGHSRGGKTTLLAGATDERIALTAANCSGCGGAGSFHHPGPACEKLADILKNFPYWFSPRLQEYIGRDSALPFDQHALKAMVAPRPLLTNEGLDDLWANPSGTWDTHAAARKVYKLLGADDKIGIFFRPGPHDFSRQDWDIFLDYADWHLQKKTPARQFNANAFI